MTIEELFNRLEDGVAALERIADELEKIADIAKEEQRRAEAERNQGL